jgi:myo-inositol 2-dehydrogenase / D-chiro-inositol 1-dehydrogenase
MNRRSFLAAAAPAVLAGSPNGKIRIGFIGVGSRGTFLLKNILAIPGVEVVAICDIKAEHLARAQKMVADAGQKNPAGVADWKRLLAMKEVDAVVSAVPVHLHSEAYLDVIASGKDLYGEKPMCLTRAECDAVVAAAERHQRIVQIGFQRRADPRYIETIAQIHAGEIGDLVEGRILWSNSWGPLYGWFGKREQSGDWIVEQAVHNWDVMNWVNRSLPVKAMGIGRDDLFRDRQPDRNVHDYYAGVVQYPNGVLVSITHSWIAASKFNDEYTRLMGTRGGIDFNTGLFSYRPDLKKADRTGHSYTGDINNTLLALKAFTESVRDRKPPMAGVREGKDAVLSCLLMRRAVYGKGVATIEDV